MNRPGVVHFNRPPTWINRDQVMKILRFVATEFDVPFLDYTDSALSGNRDLFYDARHMNADGAAAFSSNIALRADAFLRGGPDAF